MNCDSVSGFKWIFKKYDEEYVKYLKNNHSLDEITSRLLAIRNIKKENIKNYIDPKIKNILPNPNVLIDMDKACLRIYDSIIKNEKIAIFGDYDVDGAASSALLGNYFKLIKQDYEVYIPDRQKEGYGPSINGFKKLIENNSKLILTVDCGTASFEPIEYANSKNIDVLILDHHQAELRLPNAHSIINPNRLDDSSNLNYLCASGVCYMFLISLNKLLREKKWFINKNVKEPNLIEFLDLVSLGTICDVVPLVGLNRAIVKQGLKILNNKKNIGLKSLLDICKIETKVSTYHMGFILGPRINAGGRVGKCNLGANLLLNIDSKKAFSIASQLDIFNKERQLLEKDLLDKALLKINDTIDPIIVLAGDNWHEGIIGIVASRIKDKFNKPTFIISIKNNVGKCSARSVPGYDVGSLILSAVQCNVLVKGGGHKMAGGFTIDENQIDNFKNYAIKKFKKSNKDLSNTRKVLIDSIISPSALNIDFYNKINYLSPFGAGNSEPKFMIENLRVINSQIVGEKHIKSILIGKDGSNLKTIAFNSTDSEISAYLLQKNKKTFNISGKLNLNEWRGKKNVEFIIDDISVNKDNKNTVPSSIG